VRAAILSGLLLGAAAALMGPRPGPGEALRQAFLSGRGVVQLPAGVTETQAELLIPPGASDLEIRGAPGGSRLRAAANFRGHALIRCRRAARIRMRGFDLDGNRAALAEPMSLPPSNVTFAHFYRNNGILAEDVLGLEIADVNVRQVANYAILVSRSRDVRIERVRVTESGSRNAAGKNNASGGILLEDGTARFTVRDCELAGVLGNGIWTHSRYQSPRNADGLIERNRFERIGRDAVQVGHAVRVTVAGNTGSHIGYPTEAVDMASGAIPAAIDTAGNTARCVYRDNRFEEVNGKAIDLDGFHHGEIRGNHFRNSGPPGAYPQGNMAVIFNDSHPRTRSDSITVEDNEFDGVLFGGFFVIGQGHRIENNRLLNLNRAGCNESRARFGCWDPAEAPGVLQSGIYLGRGVLRPNPARDLIIRGNLITGYRMKERCIAAAPGVEIKGNRIEKNRCEDVAPAGR
jgi:hypothetical protein